MAKAKLRRKGRPVHSKRKRLAQQTTPSRPGTKQAQLIALLQRPEGATIEDLAKATSWQRHTVRGVISGALRKRLRLTVVSERPEKGARIYRITT